ncbi:MAG: M4 family metallopeptidase, partial [Planctomycetota bacterium]
MWIAGFVGVCVVALGAAPAPQAVPGLKIERSNATGLATFVTAPGGGAIAVQPAVAGRRIQPMDFLTAQGHLFGVGDAARELLQTRAEADQLGQTHTSYQQVHKGVPVFSGVLKVHQGGDGSILAANGDFYPIADRLDANPKLTADEAAARALAVLGRGQPKVEHPELVIVDPGWYGDPPMGAHLAYYIILSDMTVPVREAFFVDAHRGQILDQWNLLETSRFREVWDDVTDTWVRFEGDPPTGDFDADSAYDYSGDWYDYLARGFGRDSYDDLGANLTNVVHLVSSSCPNAYGGGGASYFCDGVANDDVVAHEWGHSLTSWTSNLIYQNQAGQLNESYSDVWGEMIDLFNGNAAFPGAPGGTPWPTDPTYVGPGTDTPNSLRTGCVGETFMTVNSPMSIAGDYTAQAASFGPPLTPTGTSANIVVADPVRGCIADLPFTNAGDMAGKIVVMDRGTCFFTEKVKNAQDAGAVAAIVANNVPGGPAPMGGGDPSITIPSVGITQADGATIKTAAESSKVNVTLRTNSSLDVRWLVGEDSTAFGGAIRDMWMPSCMGDPDRANHPFQICDPTDNGGVHSGSGIPNHAFAMLVDGKTFNGYTVSAIGPIKAGAVWYRAGTVYLTPASNFEDAYVALDQAAADLIGANIVDPRDGFSTVLFTAADAVEVDDALRAVEMNTEGLCGSWKNVLDSAPVAKCPARNVIFADDFESGMNGWTVAVSGPFGPPTPYNWFQVAGGLPFGRPGTVWHVQDLNIGDCETVDESAVHTLSSPPIALPASLFSPTLAFTHYVDVETFWDGGNIKISVNFGPFQLIPKTAFLHNEYNDRLAASLNPIAGQDAWTGFSMDGGTWGTSLIDLSSFVSGGDIVQIRFDFGKDACGGFLGWYVDDFEVYTCPTCGDEVVDPGEECDDGNLANGDGCSSSCQLEIVPPGNIVWDANDLSTDRTTRSLRFRVEGKPNGSLEDAIKVTMIDLQSPIPANAVCCPPQDFSAYEYGATCTDPGGCARWVGEPGTFYEAQGPPLSGPYRAARLQCSPFYADWVTETASGTISVVGAEIMPSSEYSVKTYGSSCVGIEATCTDVGTAVTMKTRRSGDAETGYNPPGTGQQPDAGDVTALVNKFKKLAGAPVNSRSQLQPNLPELNTDVSASDIVAVVDAYKGFAYPYGGPCPCPSLVTCG